MFIDEIKNINSSVAELKKFGKTVGTVLVIIGALLLYFSRLSFPYFLSIGFLLIIFAFTIPSILLPIHKIWMALAVLLGWVSTRVILFTLFYLVITPINLISRIFGKEFMQLKPDKKINTYWNYRGKKEFNPLDYEKQF